MQDEFEMHFEGSASSCAPTSTPVRPIASTTGVPVPKRLAVDLTDPAKLQADLFLRSNEDGLFPGFTQTWRAEG